MATVGVKGLTDMVSSIGTVTSDVDYQYLSYESERAEQ